VDNFIFQRKIKKLNFDNIFYPTDTSRLLINVSNKYLKNNQKILDLGCGGGVVSYFLHKQRLKQEFFLSDVDKLAVKRAEQNLKKKKIKASFLVGSLLKPWKGKKFDLIINDVSGVSSEIARMSHWFVNAAIDDTKGGISLLKKVISNSRDHLYQKSYILVPIISLSNVKEAQRFLKKNLKIVEFKKFYWPMPHYLVKRIVLLKKLKKKNYIDFEKKYGAWLCYTIIAVCKK
tara:strand:- start:26302 stop:26997 length:696 start_codon:yes stop_codon:yes gene_type:complete